jgi:hypothetical protein
VNPSTDDVDLAIAAVKKWLAEWDRCVRIDRRYARMTRNLKRADARNRMTRACVEASVALERCPGSSVDIDGTRYRGETLADGTSAVHVTAAPVDEPAAVREGV